MRVSNSLDPDQAQRFGGPDLDQNCLHRLSADNTSRHQVNEEPDFTWSCCNELT